MIPTTCKRLIEVDFPIAKVSEHSAKEKSIRHGHPSTLHLWWARRPLAACRAVLMSLLLPDPCDPDCAPEFKAKARQLLSQRYSKLAQKDEDLRHLLLDFISEFSDWDHASNSTYLEIGRGLVKAAHPEETPVVVDPFSGGGSIPLEALRLGCEAFATDLNPVACLILKTLLEDIPRYGNAEFRLPSKDGKEVLVHGLADALRHVGKQVKEAAEKELAQFYPPDPDGSRPIAYLWARTVQCEGVGCGAEIPLLRSFWLSKKPTRRRALRFQVKHTHGKRPQISFEVFEPKAESEVVGGFVAGGKATCPCCNTVLPAERMRAQLSIQRGGAEVLFDKNGSRVGGALLVAVATLRKGVGGRFYRLAAPADYRAVMEAQTAAASLPADSFPSEAINPVRPSPNARGLSAVTRYGVATFSDLFTLRQRLTLAVFGKIAATAFPQFQDALALAVGRMSERLTCLARWDSSPKMESVAGTFSRQALTFVWDFAEQNPLTEIGGNWDGAVDWVAQVAAQGTQYSIGQVAQADARSSPLSQRSADVWFTDPPYYDSIPYADLSDFFFVWLKRTLPNHPLVNARQDAETGLTPKAEECVWNQSHMANGRPKDGRFFEEAVSAAFAEGNRVLKPDGVSCVVFAHKSTEGWEALLSALLRAGFFITASWPITTEMATRAVARDAAALAGSVHLVCRPRPAEAGIGDWTEVKRAMEKRIRDWLPTLVKHGVRGADAIFSCLGPALESYSRYEKVLTAADREVPLGGNPDAAEPQERGFLAYVFEALSKEALRQVLGDAETEGFEEDSRLTALFLWTLQATKTNGSSPSKGGAEAEAEESTEDDGEDKSKKAKAGLTMPFDTFIRITRPMGIHYAALENRVIEIEKGVVRLLPVSERGEQLLGEAAKRPGIEISLEDVKQLELGLLTKRREEATLANAPKRGKKTPAVTGNAPMEAEFTTIDRLHRAMLLFSLGRSTILRQVLEKEMRQNQRFERLALALNALYPEGSDERRMLEGVQAAMRSVK